MFKPNALFFTDGYKLGHIFMLAPGIKRLYGTWIPRSLKHAPNGIEKIVSFGQRMAWRLIHDTFTESFFKEDRSCAVKFGMDMSSYIGLSYDSVHFEKLYDLGYLPVRVKSLPEGIETNPNIAHMTFINTHDDFAWLTLYLETFISSLSWKPATSATIAKQFKRVANKWIEKTDKDNLFLADYLCHDFSARGLSPYDMISSGLGHATSFRGSDTLVAIPAARYYYDEPDDEVIINSVNASEHSVSTTCIFTMGELEMLRYWMGIFPNGMLSCVMDTMDLTRVVKPEPDGYLSILKDEILNRNGKLIIRPDSSPKGLSPVDMICGHDNELSERELQANYPDFYRKGLVECLWDIFGGTINEQGFKVLDSHIGAIYGDAITLSRQEEIYRRLADKGFATTNIVVGVGSFTYQYNSRDFLGFAAKGGWFETDNGVYSIYKDPITDSGVKKSPRGLVGVFQNESGEYYMLDNLSKEEEETGLLERIYENGEFYNKTTFKEIRDKLNKC